MKLTPEQIKLARQYTAEEVPVPDLLKALHGYSEAIEKWLASPALKIVPPSPEDARIMDFQGPLKAWLEIWGIRCAAEARAEIRIKALVQQKPSNGAAN